MKTFVRILSFANNLTSRLVLFFGYSILGIIFGAFNIVLVIPMLQVLFKQTGNVINVQPLPDFSFSSDYLVNVFNHYFLTIVRDSGQQDALLFVCGLIVAWVIFCSGITYFERVMPAKI